MRLLILSMFLFLIHCSPVNAQITFRDSIYHQGQFRKYVVHLPGSYNPSRQHELVFILHGGTGSANGMLLFTGFNRVSDTANFIAVYPEGVYTGPNALGKPGHHWADGRKTTLPEKAGVDDISFISNLIDSLDAQFSIDLNKVFATGISNGGYMSQRLACELSDRIAAVATVAATFPDSLIQYCNSTEPISILIMNGTADAFVPTYTGGMATGTGGYVISTDEMIDIWLNNNRCRQTLDSLELPDLSPGDNSTVTRFSYTDCLGGCKIIHYKIYGGGHTWPGEVFHVPLTGVTNEDINANDIIWRFFKSHSKKKTSTKHHSSTKAFTVYPNPFSHEITIKLPHHGELLNIELYDASGLRIQSKNFSVAQKRKGKILLSDFKAGLYLIRIVTRDKIVTRKLIKQN